MKFTAGPLPGIVVIEPDVRRDPRGFFLETFHAENYRAYGVSLSFVQDNHSLSTRGTLRGLHLQLHKPQGKLVRAIRGEVWDVAVDVKPDSPTFRQWFSVLLSADNFRQIYIPPGYAHGFCVLSETAEVAYKCTAYYDPADERGIAYNDPELAIDWPVSEPLLSKRDMTNPTLASFLAASRQSAIP
jgi:dTDP-4-dehydrorhamnose 3,5-epimerase